MEWTVVILLWLTKWFSDYNMFCEHLLKKVSKLFHLS